MLTPDFRKISPGSQAKAIETAAPAKLSKGRELLAAVRIHRLDSDAPDASGAASITQDACRAIAQFTVTAPGWNKYNGHMSSVPPARSIRVGARASIRSTPFPLPLRRPFRNFPWFPSAVTCT